MPETLRFGQEELTLPRLLADLNELCLRPLRVIKGDTRIVPFDHLSISLESLHRLAHWKFVVCPAFSPTSLTFGVPSVPAPRTAAAFPVVDDRNGLVAEISVEFVNL